MLSTKEWMENSPTLPSIGPQPLNVHEEKVSPAQTFNLFKPMESNYCQRLYGSFSIRQYFPVHKVLV